MGSCTCDAGVYPWLQSTQRNPCVFRHPPEICKCNLPAIKLCQDECAYAAYLLSKREWHHRNRVPLRKKYDGPVEMESEYGSNEFAFGIKVSADSLREINRLRAAGARFYEELQEDGSKVKKHPLEYLPGADSITIRSMSPGASKEGQITLTLTHV